MTENNIGERGLFFNFFAHISDLYSPMTKMQKSER